MYFGSFEIKFIQIKSSFSVPFSMNRHDFYLPFIARTQSHKVFEQTVESVPVTAIFPQNTVFVFTFLISIVVLI